MRGEHLEGAIERLVLRIACSGFQGSSVEDILVALSKLATDFDVAGDQPPRTETGQSSTRTPPSPSVSEGNAKIWKWLTARPEVSVGKHREFNHFSLQELLALPEGPLEGAATTTTDAVAVPATQNCTATNATNGLLTFRPRLHVAESKMWECLTGHGVDYQKVPRFEWLALLGVASTLEDGILQGDLTRLVSQDKRSLPKRTDGLARKGYIVKRPILAKGCKTSKLWLKAFAPPAQVQSISALSEVCNADFPREALVNDLEPVPWRHHWMGSSIDYAMLGRTVMGVVKEFGVIRYQDLRMKLGVTGHRWQMKVVTRTCRFFIELGTLQYVTASMGNKIFRDCIKFKRDLTTDDLSSFISGGGAAFRFGNNQAPKKALKQPLGEEFTGSLPTDRWLPDKPLTIAVLEAILASEEHGITNKGLAFHTIGGYFERHISAVSTAVAIKKQQPPWLSCFQAHKEYCRSGRSASYRFFPSEARRAGAEVQSVIPACSTGPPGQVATHIDTQYGFGPVELQPESSGAKASAQPPALGPVGRKRRRDVGEPSGRKRRKTSETGKKMVPDESINEPQEPKSTLPPHGEAVGDGPGTGDTGSKSSPAGPGGNRGRGKARKSKTGGKKKAPASAKASETRYTCDTCGGTWKNDVGLKYHLRKSRTTCNPSYVEAPRVRVKRVTQTRNPRKKAPLAISRLGECKVLEPRNWKGDHALHVRDSTNRAPLRRAGDAGDEAGNPEKCNALSPSILQTLAAPIGGIIEHHLASPRDCRIPRFTSRKPASDRVTKTPIQEAHGSRLVQPYQPGLGAKRGVVNGTEPIVQEDPLSVATGLYGSEPEEVLGVVPTESLPDSESKGSACDGPPDTGHGHTSWAESTDDYVVQPFQPSPSLLNSTVVGDARDIPRIKEIVRYLLDCNGGAFPGRVALWHAVIAVWHKSFPGDPIPGHKLTHRAVKELGRKRNEEATEHMFAFRDSYGQIADCFLLVQGGVDPNLPEFEALKARMKQSHPKPFIPPAFAHQSAESGSLEGGHVAQVVSKRRKYAISVEVLDAPFYMTQSGRKEALPLAKEPPVPSQPRRGRGHGFKLTPASPWSPTTTEWQAIGGRKQIQFLQPNTHLDEDGLVLDPDTGTILHADGEGHPVEEAEPWRESGGGIRMPQVRFVDCIGIQPRDGEWPALENAFFESGGLSYTLVGSMPQGELAALNSRQRITCTSGTTLDDGSMYGTFLAQEQPEHLVARPVAPAPPREPPSKGRPRARQDRPLPRPRLMERTLTLIEDPNALQPISQGRRPVLLGDFTAEEALTVAFIAVRTLLGGSNKLIDWGFIMRLFPDCQLKDLRRSWVKLSRDRVHFLNSFSDKFQDAFLKAYEAGELPPLDYDDIQGYDWQRLIEWAIELRRTTFVKLPLRKREPAQGAPKRQFVLEDHPSLNRHWHERFFHQQASVFTRFELVTSEAATLEISDASPPGPNQPPEAEPTAVQVAMSWVRALCCTALHKCPPDLVKKKLATLAADVNRVNQLLDEAVTDLNNRRIITKRVRSKPYLLSRPFQSNLTKFSHERKFRGAFRFKVMLDETFRRGDSFKIPYLSDDGANMALINLYAHGRVNIVGSNVPDIPLGFKPGNYESRKMPKSHLLFDLLVTPTDKYLYDGDINILANAREKKKPTGAPGKLLPFWCDFYGELNVEMWTKFLGLVCFMLDIRGSMTFPMLSLQTAAFLEAFDLRMLVDWGKGIGLFVEDCDSGGLTVTEWWWLVVGKQRIWPESEPIERSRDDVDMPKPRPRGRPRKTAL